MCLYTLSPKSHGSRSLAPSYSQCCLSALAPRELSQSPPAGLLARKYRADDHGGAAVLRSGGWQVSPGTRDRQGTGHEGAPHHPLGLPSSPRPDEAAHAWDLGNKNHGGTRGSQGGGGNARCLSASHRRAGREGREIPAAARGVWGERPVGPWYLCPCERHQHTCRDRAEKLCPQVACHVLPSHSLAHRDKHGGSPRKSSRTAAGGLLALGEGKKLDLIGRSRNILDENLSETSRKYNPLPEIPQSPKGRRR